MPQMAPMNWLSLFLMFILMFLMFNSFFYHNMNYSPKMKTFKKTIINNNWKW